MFARIPAQLKVLLHCDVPELAQEVQCLPVCFRAVKAKFSQQPAGGRQLRLQGIWREGSCYQGRVGGAGFQVAEVQPLVLSGSSG